MLFELFEQELLRIATLTIRTPSTTTTTTTAVRDSIVWQEVFDIGINVSKNTIVEVWKEEHDGDTLFCAAAAGHRVILSSCWYLDHLERDFDCLRRVLQGSLPKGCYISRWNQYWYIASRVKGRNHRRDDVVGVRGDNLLRKWYYYVVCGLK
jgi:Glycosyl hydrolase family 20, catalytic domain